MAVVEGRRYLENPEPVILPKKHLKHLFTNLLRELFVAEEGSRSFGFGTDDASPRSGLKIRTRYPNVMAELPSISVSFEGLRFRRKTVNPWGLNRLASLEVDEAYGEEDGEAGVRMLHEFDGLVELNVAAADDDQRDEIVDQMVDYFVHGFNAADLDVYDYFQDRGVYVNDGEWAMNGDREVTLDTGDVVFYDGINFPIYGEVISPKKRLVPLEGIDYIEQIMDETNGEDN